MSPLLRLLAICLTFTITCLVPIAACSTLQKVEWPEVVRCTPESNALLDVVENVLNGSNYRTELEALARREGPPAVLCALKHIARGLVGSSSATGVDTAARARGFLNDVGTTVEPAAP